jgi:hypothetical protein
MFPQSKVIDEENKCAYALTKKGCMQFEDFACFETPPSDVEPLWHFDLAFGFCSSSINFYFD